MCQACGGNTSSTFSGNNQAVISIQHHQQKNAAQHRGSADKTQLAVPEFEDPAESLAPQGRRGKRQDALDHKQQADGSEPVRTCHLPPAARGFFMYLKKSALGSSTITS